MNSKPQRYIAVCMSLLLLLYTGITNSNSLKTEAKDNNTKAGTLISEYTSLIRNKHWVKIRNYWKKLNAIEPQKDYVALFKQVQELQDQIKGISKNIESLETSQLLTTRQASYLNYFIKSRLSYIEYHIGFIECYKMTMLGGQIAQTRGDLENRYDTLEKLFKEEKIDQKTFELTKNKIAEDLKFIDDNSNHKPKQQADECVTDLVILLNK